MPSGVIYVTTYDPALTHLGGAAYIDSGQIAGLRAADLSVEVFSLTGTGVPLEIRSNPSALSRTALRMLTRAEPYSLAKFKAGRGWRAQAAALAHLKRSAGDTYIVTSQTPALALAVEAGITPDAHLVHNVDAVLAETHDPRALKLLGNARLTRRREASLLNHPRQLLALSSDDAARLAGWGLAPSISAVELALSESGPSRAGRRAIGFIGKLSWPPNATALRVLLDDVMPRVRRRLGVRTPPVVVAGRGSEGLKRSGVRGLGEIATVDAFYEQVDAVVVPRLTVATGVSVKLLEAHRHGVAAIAPQALLRSAGLTEECVAADTPSELADAVCEHYGSPHCRPPIGPALKSVRVSLADALIRDSRRLQWAS